MKRTAKEHRLTAANLYLWLLQQAEFTDCPNARQKYLVAARQIRTSIDDWHAKGCGTCDQSD